MLIKDEGYMFEIWYFDEKGKMDCLRMFSDEDNIYSLQDLPQTTCTIHVRCCDLNQEYEHWKVVGQYDIGDRITAEEAKNEIKKLKDFYVEFYGESYKTDALDGLQKFLNSVQDNTKEENRDKIYLNKNIKLTNGDSIRERIKIISPASDRKIISTSQIVNGKIYSTEQINAKKEVKKIDVGDLYLDLE